MTLNGRGATRKARPGGEAPATKGTGAALARLRATLERTAHRASLVEEYLSGHAADILRRDHPASAEGATYYGSPAIKKPTWLWYVPAYLFIGGISSGAYIVATLVDMLGRAEDRPMVRAGRLVALAGMLASPALLIADLGRPERFLNMLRVFRPRSMMNLGSWVLTLFGLFTGVAVAAEAMRGLGARVPMLRLIAQPLRLVSWLGLPPAMFVGSYTGLLLSATNVPLWAGNRFLMGPLFFSSAMSTGLAATSLAARLLGPPHRKDREGFERAEDLLLTAELGLTAASAFQLGGQARPLVQGRWARLYQVGAIGVGLLLPLALPRLGLRGKRSALLRSLLVLLGGAAMRFAIVEAGKESADDPRAYFRYTSRSGSS